MFEIFLLYKYCNSDEIKKSFSNIQFENETFFLTKFQLNERNKFLKPTKLEDEKII